jgi:hypothetical protein
MSFLSTVSALLDSPAEEWASLRCGFRSEFFLGFGFLGLFTFEFAVRLG